jgi:hypothetical protein
MKKTLIVTILSTLSFASMASGWDKVTPSADFRYRHENSKDEFKSEGQTRQRLRARLGLKYQVDKSTKIDIRLATSASSATSTNDTLGDSAGGANTVYFDRAYISHNAGDVKVNMGRMKFPMFKAGKSQMIFDGDFNPEGIHAGYKLHGVYINLASFWYDENKTTSDVAKTDNVDGLDVTITSSQIGYAAESAGIKYNFGLSNYHYENAHEVGTFADEGMNILETYLELKWQKLTFFYSATVNNEVEEDNSANIIGLSFGKTKTKGNWKVGANMRTVELNAVNPTLMDGDFAGQKTDSTGTIIYGKYMTTDNAYVSFGIFNNTKNSDKKSDSSKESEAYTKMQFDYGVKF